MPLPPGCSAASRWELSISARSESHLTQRNISTGEEVGGEAGSRLRVTVASESRSAGCVRVKRERVYECVYLREHECVCVYLPEGSGRLASPGPTIPRRGCVLRVMGLGDRSLFVSGSFPHHKLCAPRQALSPL